MYLRRINVNLYQDIKVLTHYCSTIGKPISGLDSVLKQISEGRFGCLLWRSFANAQDARKGTRREVILGRA